MSNNKQIDLIQAAILVMFCLLLALSSKSAESGFQSKVLLALALLITVISYVARVIASFLCRKQELEYINQKAEYINGKVVIFDGSLDDITGRLFKLGFRLSARIGEYYICKKKYIIFPRTEVIMVKAINGVCRIYSEFDLISELKDIINVKFLEHEYEEVDKVDNAYKDHTPYDKGNNFLFKVASNKAENIPF